MWSSGPPPGPADRQLLHYWCHPSRQCSTHCMATLIASHLMLFRQSRWLQLRYTLITLLLPPKPAQQGRRLGPTNPTSALFPCGLCTCKLTAGVQLPQQKLSMLPTSGNINYRLCLNRNQQNHTVHLCTNPGAASHDKQQHRPASIQVTPMLPRQRRSQWCRRGVPVKAEAQGLPCSPGSALQCGLAEATSFSTTLRMLSTTTFNACPRMQTSSPGSHNAANP
jgi:hypothetical protein